MLAMKLLLAVVILLSVLSTAEAQRQRVAIYAPSWTPPDLTQATCTAVGWSVAPENPQQDLYLGKCPPVDRSFLIGRLPDRPILPRPPLRPRRG
jgi:hypothetical protein